MEGKLIDMVVSLVTFGYFQRSKKDRLIFEDMMKELPPDSQVIKFLNEHDLGNPFEFEMISPLNGVVDDWRRVDRIFLNRKIEKKKEAFLKKTEEFLRRFSERSGGDKGDLISIGMRDWEDRPEMFEYRDNLNRLASEAFSLYNEFYSYTQKKLPI